MRNKSEKPKGLGFVVAYAALLLVPLIAGADLLERQTRLFDAIRPAYGHFERSVATTIDGSLSITRSIAVLGVDGVETVLGLFAKGTEAVIRDVSHATYGYTQIADTTETRIRSGYARVADSVVDAGNEIKQVQNKVENAFTFASLSERQAELQGVEKRTISSEKILAQGKHITDGYVALADGVTKSVNALSETAVASVGESYGVADGAMDILSGGVASASESFAGIADWTRTKLRTWLGIGDVDITESPTPVPVAPAVVIPAPVPTTTIVERLTERVISSGSGVSTSQIDTAIGVAIDGLRAELTPQIQRAMRSPSNRDGSSSSGGTTVVSGDYLPLAGGILTGALTGTNATFSGAITAGTGSFDEVAVTGSTTFNGVEYLFPGADGASGEFLSTDGAGGLTWVAAAGGIASLNGQANAVQTFASSSDTNIGLSISSAGGIHTFTTAWNGLLSVLRGGTGTSTAPSYGQVLVGDGSGGYALTATSSLGISVVQEWTDGGTFDYDLENVYVGTSTAVVNQPLFAVGTSSALFSVAGTNGFVGIRDTTPSDFLDINTAGVVSGGIRLAGASVSKINFADSWYVGQDWNQGTYFSIGTAANDSAKFRLQTDGDLEIDTDTVFVDATNNRVGIGTTSPYAKLSVVGDAAITGGLYDNNATRGANGEVLMSTGTGLTWVATSTLGMGNVTSTSTVTDNAIARFDGTTGQLIQNSAATIDDTTGLIRVPTNSGITSSGNLALSSGVGSVVSISSGGQTTTSGINFVVGAVSDMFRLTQTGALLRGDFQYLFRSGSSFSSGSTDTGLARSSAGVLRVTDGSSGGGSLMADYFTATSTTATSTFAGDIKIGADTGLARSAVGVLNVTDGNTGLGNLKIKAQAGTTLSLSLGADLAGLNGDGNGLYLRGQGVGAVSVDDTAWRNFWGLGYRVASDGSIGFSNTTNPRTGTPDVGLERLSAGALKVTDGSTGLGEIYAGKFGARSGTTNKIQMAPAAGFGLTLASDMNALWFPSTDLTGSADAGISRSSAGILKVTDGSTGNGAILVGTAFNAVTGLKLDNGSGHGAALYARNSSVLGFSNLAGTIRKMELSDGALSLASDYELLWTAQAKNAATASVDIGLARSAAGVLKVTDGSTGLGSLVVRSGASTIDVVSDSDKGISFGAEGDSYYAGALLGSSYNWLYHVGSDPTKTAPGGFFTSGIGVTSPNTTIGSGVASNIRIGDLAVGVPGVGLRSNAVLTWASGADGYTSQDLGLARSSAGVLRVTNGSSGGGSLMADYFTATSTATTTIPTLSVTGLLYDGTGTGGANGDVLTSTGTGLTWVATSTLGLGGGTGSGTVNSGTTGYAAYYAADGTAVSATSSLFFDSNSRVGIGTTTPQALFHVDGGTSASPLTYAIRLSGTGATLNSETDGSGVLIESGSGAAATFPNTSGVGGTLLLRGGVGGANDGGVGGNGGAVSISGGAGGFGGGGDGTGGKVYIDGSSILFNTTLSGNVGIATTSPLAKLDVYGNAILSGLSRYLNFGDTSGASGYGFRDNAGTMEFKNSGGSWAALGSSASEWVDAGSYVYPNEGDYASFPYLVSTSTATSTFAGGIEITGDIVPTADNVYSLGASTTQWKDVWIGPGSLYINGQKVLEESASNIVISADINQSLHLKTSGSGDIELNPTGTGLIALKGNMQITGGKIVSSSDNSAILFEDGLRSGNLQFVTNTLSSTNTDGDIIIDPDGTGDTYIASGNFGIATTVPLAKLDVYGNAMLSGTGRYLNFGDTSGTNGYGFRDNGGTIEFKNSGGSWATFGAGSSEWTDAGSFVYPNDGDYASAPYFVATSTATSTIPTLAVTGLLYDGTGTGGANGDVLMSTGTGVTWVATSTLGISSDVLLGSAPAASNSTATAGEIAFDTDYVYVATAADTWKRAALTSYSSSIPFTWASDGDTNGLFYYYGTNYNAEAWANPYTAGRLGITIGGTLALGTPADAVDRASDGNFCVSPQVGNYLQFDLGLGKTVAVDKYSIRSRDHALNRLTTWTLTGSNDGTNWTTLDTRTGETVAQNTWYNYAVSGASPFRYLRLTRTGNDSSGNTYLCIGEIEFYGAYSDGSADPQPWGSGTAGALAIWDGANHLTSDASLTLLNGNLSVTATSTFSGDSTFSGITTFDGQVIASSTPTGTGVSQGVLYVNPSSFTAAGLVSWSAKTAWDTGDLGGNSRPAFVDIDADGDLDFYNGQTDGVSDAWENTGTVSNHIWTLHAAWSLPDVGLNVSSQPSFADLDNDGDYDALVGLTSGITNAYENTGSASSPVWTAKAEWGVTDVGSSAAPGLADLDNDGDADVLVGEDGGTTRCYINTGGTTSPTWSYSASCSIGDIGVRPVPTFGDMDGDGDLDLFLGNQAGTPIAYENTGSVSSPVWTRNASWDLPDVGGDVRPGLADLDNDGDYDMLIGLASGAILGYENVGSAGSSSNTLFGVAVGGAERFKVTGESITASGYLTLNNYLDLTYSGSQTASVIQQNGSGDLLNVLDGSTEVFTILDGGNVGIGSSTPHAKLSLKGSANVANIFEIASSTDANILTVTGTGMVGVGTTTPWRTFSASGTVAFNGLTTSSGTPDALCLQPGGEVTVNTGAQTCTVSSLRFKHDVTEIDLGLETIQQLKPSSFVYNSATTTPRVGLIAEEVALVDSRLVFFESDGTTPRGVRYEDIVAVLVKAIQELNVKVDAALAAAGAGVSDLVVQFKELVADKITTKKLCLDDVCVTKDELQKLLESAGIEETSTSTPVDTTPLIDTGAPEDTATSTPTDTSGGTNTTTSEISDETASSTETTIIEEPSSVTEESAQVTEEPAPVVEETPPTDEAPLETAEEATPASGEELLGDSVF